MVTLAILLLPVMVTLNCDDSPQRGWLSLSSGIMDGEAEGLVTVGWVEVGVGAVLVVWLTHVWLMLPDVSTVCVEMV
jgi:hypothetical protein